ncbi:hypothetical protein [Oceanisphaera sp.]|uniref:hypothetical protein n=1 Tax=Oceanisphaera sp. TaxID=1929979 RepID=UPI003A8ECA1C
MRLLCQKINSRDLRTRKYIEYLKGEHFPDSGCIYTQGPRPDIKVGIRETHLADKLEQELI